MSPASFQLGQFSVEPTAESGKRADLALYRGGTMVATVPIILSAESVRVHVDLPPHAAFCSRLVVGMCSRRAAEIVKRPIPASSRSLMFQPNLNPIALDPLSSRASRLRLAPARWSQSSGTVVGMRPASWKAALGVIRRPSSRLGFPTVKSILLT